MTHYLSASPGYMNSTPLTFPLIHLGLYLYTILFCHSCENQIYDHTSFTLDLNQSQSGPHRDAEEQLIQLGAKKVGSTVSAMYDAYDMNKPFCIVIGDFFLTISHHHLQIIQVQTGQGMLVYGMSSLVPRGLASFFLSHFLLIFSRSDLRRRRAQDP